MFKRIWMILIFVLFGHATAYAEEKIFDSKLNRGDTIKVFVYKNPDLNAEYRIQETGQINFPLVGAVDIAGKPIPEAEKLIAGALVSGGFLQNPQVSISIVTPRKRQAVVLGFVAKPSMVPLDYVNTRLSDVLAVVGGVLPGGADVLRITGVREDKPFKTEVNVNRAFMEPDSASDPLIQGGDVIYVPRADVFYAYGEVQRPGAYRLEESMTIQQALVISGGVTKRGSETRIRLQRRNDKGVMEELSPTLFDVLKPNDVLFVKESLF